MRIRKSALIGLWVALFISPAAGCAAYPVAFQDATGPIVIEQRPQRVVSVVPSITEILFRIGAGDTVKGVTYFDTYPAEAARKPGVGGLLTFSPDRIQALKTDIIFVDDRHRPIADANRGKTPPLVIQLPLSGVDDLYRTIRLLGRIFDRAAAAESLVSDIQFDLVHTAEKLAPIPATQRKRVLCLMGQQAVMTTGDDSFQNEMIRLAGGIPPTLGKSGSIVPVTLEEWQSFNPQVIYGCDEDRKMAMAVLAQPGWREVDAVKNGRVIHLPCDLTCRLSTRAGYFVSILASRIYADPFAVQPVLRPDGRVASQGLPLALAYVDSAEIVESLVNDYVHNTLVVHLAKPMSVVSTLEGFRDGVRHVGNSYSPPQVWGRYHRIGLKTSRQQLMRAIEQDAADTSLLFTGADMDNLSVQRQQFKKITVYALVTAGVRSNAVRMAEDTGRFYEPGTINMIILTNMQLTPRAMHRAIISATEAKTAALQDLDIRSAYTPMANPATGTGTDNIIVVQGAGVPIDNAGGHSKMGELIAKAVYAGVQEAVFRQNGIVPQRNVFQRLKERKISLLGLVSDCSCSVQGNHLTRELEKLLMNPAYTGFIEAVLSISDDHERGLVTDLNSVAAWCNQTAAVIAGKPITSQQVFTYAHPLPTVIKMAFDALLNGLHARLTTLDSID